MPHRPIFKVIVNTLLRGLQCRSLKPLLIVSVFESDKLVGYKMGRVELKQC